MGLAVTLVVVVGAITWVAVAGGDDGGSGASTVEPTDVRAGGPRAGDVAPDFTAQTLDGKTVRLSDFRGQPVVLNFWASWCAPCVQEVPSLEAFQHVLGPQGVVVLGVSIDTSQKRYEQFLRRFRVDFPTARDPEANISSNYGTFQIPETYLIDSTGKVREKIISNQNWVDPQFLERVKTMLR